MSSDHPPADALQLLDALERCVEIREEFRPRLYGLCMVKRFYPEKEFSGQDLDLWVFAVGNFFEQWIEGRLDVWGRRDGSLGWSLIPHDFAIYVDPQSVDWYPGHISLPNGETVYCIRVAPATTVDTVSADQLNGRSRRGGDLILTQEFNLQSLLVDRVLPVNRADGVIKARVRRLRLEAPRGGAKCVGPIHT